MRRNWNGKMFFIVVVFAGLLVGISQASAGDDFIKDYKFYTTVKGGIVLFANQGSVTAVNPRATGMANQDSTANAMIGAFALGYRPLKSLRLELEASMQSKLGFHNNHYLSGGISTNDIEVNNSSFFFKGYYDFRVHPCVNPYLTAGLGYSRNESKGTQTYSADATWNQKWQTTTTDNLGWLVGIGMNWALHERVIIELAYEYRDLGEWKLANLPATGDESMKGHLTGHIILMGFRGHF
jgi:opacity protein-like surface antigen